MKKATIIILGLLIVAAVTGCAGVSKTTSTKTIQDTQQLENTGDSEVLEDLNQELISEENFIEVGEMI